eukprot:118695-Hanusia_phi.AAC.1
MRPGPGSPAKVTRPHPGAARRAGLPQCRGHCPASLRAPRHARPDRPHRQARRSLRSPGPSRRASAASAAACTESPSLSHESLRLHSAASDSVRRRGIIGLGTRDAQRSQPLAGRARRPCVTVRLEVGPRPGTDSDRLLTRRQPPVRSRGARGGPSARPAGLSGVPGKSFGLGAWTRTVRRCHTDTVSTDDLY